MSRKKKDKINLTAENALATVIALYVGKEILEQLGVKVKIKEQTEDYRLDIMYIVIGVLLFMLLYILSVK